MSDIMFSVFHHLVFFFRKKDPIGFKGKYCIISYCFDYHTQTIYGIDLILLKEVKNMIFYTSLNSYKDKMKLGLIYKAIINLKGNEKILQSHRQNTF